MMVVDLAIRHSMEGYKLTSETELRREAAKAIGEPGKREHVPDLVLEKDGKVIAVEFENSPKSTDRMEKVLKFYGRSRKYDECWFFCSSETWMNRWKKAGAEKIAHVKVLLWEEEENGREAATAV